MELSFILAELLAALRARGCAFCRLHAARERRYIRTLLAEQTNDGLTLASFAASHGWCSHHAATLVQVNLEDWGNLRKTAILYEAAWAGIAPVLDEWEREAASERDPNTTEIVGARRQRLFGHRLAQGPGPRGGFEPVTAEPGARERLVAGTAAQPCPLCQSMAEYDQLVYSVVAPALRQSRLRRAWEAADPICLPHLHALLEHVESTADQDWLVSDAHEKVRLLEQEVDGYLSRRYRGRSGHADSEPEQAVLRLLAWFSGEPQTVQAMRETVSNEGPNEHIIETQ